MSTTDERRASIGSENSDSVADQGCFIFSQKRDDAPPQKRRRIAKSAKLSDAKHPLFPSLLGQAEGSGVSELRYQTFQEEWSLQERRIKDILDSGNAKAAQDVIDFIGNAESITKHEKIPTALIAAGPSISTHQSLFGQIAREIKNAYDCPIAQVDCTQSVNLKGVLKHVIQHMTCDDDEDEVEDFIKESGFLNYDLQILESFVKQRQKTKVIVIFRDIEAMSIDLLSDLISLLASWRDRIPFILLFGVATSVELFQEKLSYVTIRLLEGKAFEVESANEALKTLFVATIRQDLKGTMWLGPDLLHMLLKRQKNHLQSPQAFVQSTQYTYLSHFFANALSVLLSRDVSEKLSPEHCAAIRNLPSFRQYIEQQLEDGNTKLVRCLLNDDHLLAKEALNHLHSGQSVVNDILRGIDLIILIDSVIRDQSSDPSSLYIKGLAGHLQDSAQLRDLILSLKKIPSDVFQSLLAQMPVPLSEDSNLLKVQRDLKALLSTSSCSLPISAASNTTKITTRIGTNHRIALGQRAPSPPSEITTKYSTILSQFCDIIDTYFSSVFVNPMELFMHEVFIYDLKSPHRDTFSPKPRLAIERALSHPHDYLDCECCDGPEGSLQPTQPPTALLYQLYLESGALINVFDLWSAFYTIIGGDQGEEMSEEQALSLFYRGLAELKMLGMIKSSRRKTDHIAKLAWKGL